MSEPTRTSFPEPESATRTSASGAISGTGDSHVAAPPGYELLDEIGSGGMGVVYRARDLDLVRDVAVKILLPRYAPESSTARRFVDEARITGRLQHPGIPAIYRVGTLADGRPFLAMKLIAGRTLDAMLASGGRESTAAEENQAADAPRSPDLPGFGPVAHANLDRLDAFLQRGRFLAIFEQVAQAVGYAHKQGVIHRDLKPANVMVGAFGEVQVMDWGIARSGDRKPETGVVDSGGQAATVEYGLSSDSGSPQGDLTQAGAILGTPAYMPPEQAIGAVDQVGKHSDVFGLGAILCVILTGKPPYLGADAESNRQLAARGKLDEAFSRLDASGAEAELVALAKRCLAPEAADRPRDAGEVAEAVGKLRADAERRAREAEMERARVEVQATEERKRRRVKQALAATVVGLWAVAGAAAWWIDRERSQRAAEREADQLREVAAANARAAELRERGLAYERDVKELLTKAEEIIRRGREGSDDLEFWFLALNSALLPLDSAEKLLKSGSPTDELRRAFDAVADSWAKDISDRMLLVNLERVADGNEIRMLIPIAFSTVTARQYAAAFKKHRVDLLTVPIEEAVAWLKEHRLRDRLVIAIRNWRQSYPVWEPGPSAERSVMGAATTAALAKSPVVAALWADPNKRFEKSLLRQGPHARLGAILRAVTDDPFARQWWDAVEKRDAAKLGELVNSPEIGRMTSRELAALAEGLTSAPGTPPEVLGKLLADAYERFPGEFWVHFRLAFHAQFTDKAPDPGAFDPDESLRHLTAALAIRPNSAIARAALGMVMVERAREKKEDERPGVRMLYSAAKAEPNSPWPHMFIGMYAMDRPYRPEKGEGPDWKEAMRAMKEVVRVDADTGYFMLSGVMVHFLTTSTGDPKQPGDREVEQFLNELVATHPNHPGGYRMLGEYNLLTGDHRAALAMFRKAKTLPSQDSAGRSRSDGESSLEAEAAWEEKLPAVLRGEIKPANSAEVGLLATYCATFEKKFALATRVIIEGAKAHPRVLDSWNEVARYAGWAVQAGVGNGADGADLTAAQREEFRRLALQWLRDAIKRQPKAAESLDGILDSVRDLAPVRDPKELAKLSPEERDEWVKLWVAIYMNRPEKPNDKSKQKGTSKTDDSEANPPPREVAPKPSEVKK